MANIAQKASISLILANGVNLFELLFCMKERLE